MQSYYNTSDQINFGTYRFIPTVSDSRQTIIPPNLPQVNSFVGSSDEDVSQIINGVWGQDVANDTVGDQVLFIFDDNTRAEYRLDSIDGNHVKHWVWNGVAFDAQGNRIDRNGQPLTPPSKSGTSHGTTSLNGFVPDGQGINWMWVSTLENAGSLCQQTVTIYDNGVVTDSNVAYVPCN